MSTSGLLPGKSYWYRVYAYDEISTVAVSNVVEVVLQAH
jgi:phosphodiesterase/alkaline phosphatase D-like protein